MNTEKNPSTGLILEVFGPTVEFLTSQENFSVLRGTVPPGAFVPLHTHPDVEDFTVLSGELECLRQDATGHEWIVAKVGDYIHVPGGARHAWRNVSNKPAIALIFTTQNLERFFREIGRPAAMLQPPTPDELAHLAVISDKYGYWNASPEENEQVGIHFSF